MHLQQQTRQTFTVQMRHTYINKNEREQRALRVDDARGPFVCRDLTCARLNGVKCAHCNCLRFKGGETNWAKFQCFSRQLHKIESYLLQFTHFNRNNEHMNETKIGAKHSKKPFAPPIIQ